jgi:superoxide dismutase, Fe-Mn family
MPYHAENFDRLLGTPGFSDDLLKTHFKLYEGYVTNLNKIIEKSSAMLKDKRTADPEFAELRRRFGWEFNGMRLHELYFGNMTKDKHPYQEDSRLAQKIKEDFESFGNWAEDFKGTGAMRGIGWAALYYDIAGDRLWNVWVNEHDTAHLSGCAPILILDVFEHAFMKDYGTRRADYLAAFFNAICWKTAEQRFEEAMLLAERNVEHFRQAQR